MTLFRRLLLVLLSSFLSLQQYIPLLEAFPLAVVSRRELLIHSSSLFSLVTTLMSSSSNTASLEESTTVNWGIVGLGDVTLQKSGPAFYKSDNSQLVAVMRRTPGMAQKWVTEQQQRDSSLLSECKGYDNLEEFLHHPGLSAVYIATPPGAHLEVAKQVAAAGLPAYVEKPVGRCAWETQEMASLFESKSVPFYTAYISRAYKRTLAVQKLLQDCVIGDRVTSVHYTLRGMGGARGMESSDQKLPWRLDAAQSGGGLIMDVGCHLIDRIDYLFGPMVNIKGAAMNKDSPYQDVEDYVELHAEIGPSSWAFIDSVGARVDCTWDFSSDETLDELIIQGPKGSLRMAAMSPSLPVQVLDVDGNVVQELTFEAPQHTAQQMIQRVTSELVGKELTKEEAACISRGDNAVRTSKVLDTILSSYYGGRDDEFWLRPETWPGRSTIAKQSN
jgi:1,5-anhydro-D-fructose reductase (1,5-anhydro-D-mannitol-forming)